MVVEEIKNFGQQDRTPGPKVIEFAFDVLGPDSKLFNLLADLYIFNKNATHKGDYPKAFLDLIVKRFLSWRNSGGITISAGLTATARGSHKWASEEYHQKAEEED
jgi:hypothetical protein